VKIVGSTALLPLVAKAADLFHQSHPGIQITVEGGGSLAGLDAVTNHKTDIGDSDIYADPSVYPDPNLTDHIVCATSFALIVNPQVTITSLSTQQIIDIFSAKIVNWKEVGGPDLPITPVIRPGNSGTRALFEKYVLGGSQETGTPISVDSSTSVLDAVAHIAGAIGYITTVTADSTVRTIAIDGISPTIQNIQSGKYKFWGYEHMYTLQNGINATTEFLDFMQSPQVQQLAQQLGYVSVDTVKSLSPTGSMNG
jgi:phosphate transport system substrate-binding protein